MCGSFKFRGLVLSAVLVFTALNVQAAQVVSSTARGVGAVMRHGDYYLNPIASAGQFRGDLAPVQSFELVRPMDQRITIGRLFTSCTCVRLESPKQTYEPGEPAIFHLRNVRLTPQNGQTYAMYVQVVGPVRTTLRYDTFVQSSQFRPVVGEGAPEVEEIIADGEVVIADGEFEEGVAIQTGDVELIVPKADHYAEDTSEYTMRKKAEAELDAVKGGVQDKATAKDDKEDKDAQAEKTEAKDDKDAQAEKTDKAEPESKESSKDLAKADAPDDVPAKDATKADDEEEDAPQKSAAPAASESEVDERAIVEKTVKSHDDLWESVGKPKKKIKNLSENSEKTEDPASPEKSEG